MKTLQRVLLAVLVFVVLILLLLLSGPRVDKPNLHKELPEVSSNLFELDLLIGSREDSIPNIRPGNQARILWYDSIPTKTPYSMVYLHGWSASSEEGAPVHEDLARRFGCNLYLPRLAGHGLIEEEPMLTLTADQYLQSAKEALAIASKLGDSVIVMGTSTGATLALHLAESIDNLAGLMLYSPNVKIKDPNARLLSGPWGLQLARWVKGDNYHGFEGDSLKQKYWTTRYRLEALTHLQVFVDETMNEETFRRVDEPVFMGYYFKNEEVQDEVVSVPAMKEMFEELSTPDSRKRQMAFGQAGDHVITSYVTSKQVEDVEQASVQFLEEVIGLRPRKQQ